MAVHDLKTWPVYFDAVVSGEKNFEVRRDDRGFQKGDTLILRKHDPSEGYVTHPITRERFTVRRRVTWILTGGQGGLGIEPGFVVMGLKDESE